MKEKYFSRSTFKQKVQILITVGIGIKLRSLNIFQQGYYFGEHASEDAIKDGLHDFFGRASVANLDPWASNIGMLDENS